MSAQRNEYQIIFSYLRSINFHYLETWVIECIEYYKSNNPNISLEALKNEVKQQWLLVNLREIKVPCLPPDLKSKDKIILNGNYAVQVESMIDSSVSCYSQFQKLLKVNVEDIEVSTEPKEIKNKSKRCLTFVICDGVQEVEAMEYQPIKKLKTNDPELLPGFKMLIIGPVECRKGMILLKDENVRICGGEVDSLTVSNSLKKILMKKLELDEADYSDTAPANCVEVENESSNIPSSEIVPEELQQGSFADAGVETLLSQNDDLFLSLSLDNEVLSGKTHTAVCTSKTQNVSSETQNVISEIDLTEEDIDMNWDEVNTVNCMPNKKKHVLSPEDLETPKQKRRSLDLELKKNQPGSFAFHNSLDEDKDLFIDDFDEPCPALSSSTKTKQSVQTKLSSFFKSCDSSLDKVQKTSVQKKPVYVSNKPFVYFKQVMALELTKPTVFLFKAIILTLKKKITIDNDEFHLSAIVTDGSLAVDVDFCSTVLEDLLGFSPCEMAVMLKAKQTNSAISQRIKESYAKAQEKLISLNCIMEIKFFIDGRIPVILSLEEVTVQHLGALKERKL